MVACGNIYQCKSYGYWKGNVASAYRRGHPGNSPYFSAGRNRSQTSTPYIMKMKFLPILAFISTAALSAQTTLNFEAENLSYTGSGATTSVQTDTNSSGGKWVELAGNSTGDHIDFTVPGVPAGTYQLKMEWKGLTNRGILQLSVDGTNLGSKLDQYSAGQTYPTTTFGNVTFGTTGSHTVRLTVTGKNAASKGEVLSADKFTLIQQ